MSEPTQPPGESSCGSCSQHLAILELTRELQGVHRVHIDDIRALLAQFQTEKAEWSEKLQQAVGRECGALCNDIEQDRDELTKEIQQLREEGVPGVMHQADRLRLQVVEGDRDRFASLHANLVRRNRNLIGEFRAARHASRNVRLIESLLADALGREPSSINGDNIEDAFTELVRQRDELRERLAVWAASDSSFTQNSRILADLEQRFSEVIGTDVRRDQMAEMFDHLVKTYRGQATEIEVLEAQRRDHYCNPLHAAAGPDHEDRLVVDALRQKLGEAASYDGNPPGGTPGGIPRDQVVPLVTQLLAWFLEDEGNTDWPTRGQSAVEDRLVVDTLRQKLGEATGQDVPRDRVVATFDWMVQRAAEVAARTGTELRRAEQRAEQRADAAEEQVRRHVDEGNRREAAMAQAHAMWAAEMAAERARYAGLESVAQATGEQLTRALGWCDQARVRRAADVDMTRRAYGIIVGAGLDDAPSVDLRERAREWIIAHEIREQELRSTAVTADPLAGFTVWPSNNGRDEPVEVELTHSDDCRFSVIFPGAPSPGVELPSLLSHAHRHMLERHPHPTTPTPLQDEASPDDGELPCESICHPSQGACCGITGRPPTEVDK